MRGYKAFQEGLTNRYGYTYELGKKYVIDGELKWSENGFHFCSRPEDTLRYINGFQDGYTITEVEGSGEITIHEDEYYGFYNMYVSSEMEILRIVPREEVFNMVINNFFATKRLIGLSKLTEYEKEEILKKHPLLEDAINYYQSDEFILKRKRD